MRQFLRYLVSAKSLDRDTARRERILNILLVCTIALSTYFLIALLVDGWGKQDYQGAPLEIASAFALSLWALFFFSKGGLHRIVAYIFVGILFLAASYTSFIWGVDAAQGLLLFALIIVMSGVLIGTKFAIITSASCALTLFGISYVQVNDIVAPDTFWKDQPFYYRDTTAFTVTLGAITLVSWLFNREIERALHRARGSEKALKKERNLLEVKVEERTKELKKVQLEKVRHLYRLADFGRMTAGLFHDLVNPLTMVSLNLERLQARGLGARKRKVNNDTKKLVGRAVDGTRRMREFVKAVRKQIQKQKTEAYFSLNDEIAQVMEVIEHRTKELRVKLSFASTKKIRTYGNPFRFNQLVSNLVCNAIDSYEKIRRRKNRKVIIALLTKNNKAILVVQDFGCGITKKDTKKIFDPFFTTKSIEKGTGIGLSICKDITEKEFGGKIKVKSKEGKGATFTVEFPIKKRA